jgi:hypothetical protein
MNLIRIVLVLGMVSVFDVVKSFVVFLVVFGCSGWLVSKVGFCVSSGRFQFGCSGWSMVLVGFDLVVQVHREFLINSSCRSRGGRGHLILVRLWFRLSSIVFQITNRVSDVVSV